MKVIHKLFNRVVLTLAILCTVLLAYNILAIQFYKKQVFIERGMITTGGEMGILVGFIVVLIFNIVSLLWVSSRRRQSQTTHKKDWMLLILGALCLILLVGDKVMVDEIGREYLLGWEVIGEWIILYVFLSIQLLYNFVILQRMYRTYVKKRPNLVYH